MKFRRVEAFSEWEGENTLERKRSQGERALALRTGCRDSPASAAKTPESMQRRMLSEPGMVLEHVLLPSRQGIVTFQRDPRRSWL